MVGRTRLIQQRGKRLIRTEKLKVDDLQLIDARALLFEVTKLTQLVAQRLSVAARIIAEDLFHVVGQILATLLRKRDLSVRKD